MTKGHLNSLQAPPIALSSAGIHLGYKMIQMATQPIYLEIRRAATMPPPERPPTRPVTKPVRDDEDGGGAVVLERRPEKIKPPQMYQVALLNDDYTPMEFVVMVIQEFFNKDRETATAIMLKIHLDGKGICGVFSKDVAATKVDQVTEAARKSGHPLQCVAEPI
jgi:ATP-dependent Clp protease adaptor protein ClpS